jgi:Holliday junction resolvase
LELNESYKVYKILNELYERVGDSEFGYRVQGLFAHILIYLDIRILEIKPRGHPDIIGAKENDIIKFEVETVLGNSRKRVVDIEDIEAINPYNKNEKGYIAILYCKFPPEWLLIDHNRLKWRVSERISIITIKSLGDKKFSNESTNCFYKLILSNKSRLFKLTFHHLCDKALRGEKL